MSTNPKCRLTEPVQASCASPSCFHKNRPTSPRQRSVAVANSPSHHRSGSLRRNAKIPRRPRKTGGRFGMTSVVGWHGERDSSSRRETSGLRMSARSKGGGLKTRPYKQQRVGNGLPVGETERKPPRFLSPAKSGGLRNDNDWRTGRLEFETMRRTRMGMTVEVVG